MPQTALNNNDAQLVCEVLDFELNGTMLLEWDLNDAPPEVPKSSQDLVPLAATVKFWQLEMYEKGSRDFIHIKYDAGDKSVEYERFVHSPGNPMPIHGRIQGRGKSGQTRIIVNEAGEATRWFYDPVRSAPPQASPLPDTKPEKGIKFPDIGAHYRSRIEEIMPIVNRYILPHKPAAWPGPA